MKKSKVENLPQKSALPAKKIIKVGKVVSTKMSKTLVVSVEKIIEHPLYHKKYRIDIKYKVHDPHGQAKVGDKVFITPCRPISKEKKWQIVEKVKSKNVKVKTIQNSKENIASIASKEEKSRSDQSADVTSARRKAKRIST